MLGCQARELTSDSMVLAFTIEAMWVRWQAPVFSCVFVCFYCRRLVFLPSEDNKKPRVFFNPREHTCFCFYLPCLQRAWCSIYIKYINFFGLPLCNKLGVRKMSFLLYAEVSAPTRLLTWRCLRLREVPWAVPF